MTDEEQQSAEDLKNGKVPPENDPAGNDGEETVTIKKSDLAKIESDRDNYRTVALKKKADERANGDEKDDTTNNSGDADVTRLVDERVGAFQQETYKSHERRAQRALLQLHPEYADDASYTDLMSDFTSKRGKATSEDIIEDMEDAILLHKRRTGKLDEYMKSERERGRAEGRMDSQVNLGKTLGGTGDRNEKSTDTPLSAKGLEMAQGMHVNPTKAAQVDPRKDNVIDLSVKK